MSQTLSPSAARCYGLARVARVWSVSRACVYRSLNGTPPDMIARRPGPVGACSDAELADCGFRRLRALIPIDRGQRSERSRAPFRAKAGSRLPSAA